MRKIQLLKQSSWRQLILILFLCLGMNEIGNAQFLSGILPQYGAVVHQSTTTLSWNLLPGATSYNVTIAQDELFTQNVQSSGPITNTNWTVSSLVLGSWFWKVEGTTLLGTVAGEIEMFTRFDPTAQASLSLWLKADAGIVLDASNKIESWTDQSPSALQFTQITASKRPELTASSFGGFPSLSFTGGTKSLSGGDVLDLGLNSRSFYVIGKMAATNQTFFSKTIAAQAAARYGMIKDGASTAFICQTDAVTQNHVYSPTNTSNFALYNAQINRSPVQVRFLLNGILLGTNITNANYNWNSTYRFLIGAYNNATDNGELLPLNGNISEMIFIDTDDPNERMKTENYIKFKYHSFSAGVDIYKTDFCSASISLPVGFTNIEWSNGATSQTISVTESVLLTVQATDPLGFLWQDTILVTYPTIPSPVDTNICIGQSSLWNADLGPGFNYLWSTGATTPALTITSPGSYSVQVTDGLGCIKNSGTLNFTIDNYSQTAYLGNDTTLCANNLIALQSGAAETVSYIWPTVTPNDQANYSVVTTGVYWLESTNVNGCVAQDTINVIVSGTAPNAVFTGQNRCLGVANTFTDGSAGVVGDPVTSWSWDFGDGVGVSSAQNPSYTYTTPGTYTVELYALSQGGCGSFHTTQIEVYVPPTASYTYTGSCSDQQMQFTNQSTAGDAVINQYAWNFGQPSLGAQNVSSVQNPYRSFPTGGTYPMSLTVTDAHLCADDTVMQILVNASPIIDVFAPDACAGGPIQFTNNTVVQTPATYLWNFGDNTTSILPLPNKQYSTEGLKTITVKVTAANGCFTSDTIQMTVHPVPVASFDLGPHCKGSYTEVQSTSTITTGSIADLFWVVNLTDTLYGNPAGYVITNLNQQQIQLFIESDFGCTDDQNLFFDPEGAITASFTFPSPVAAVGDTVEFTNTSIGATNFTWNFGDGNSLIQENPSHVYATSWEDSTVVVELIVSNALGCIDTAQLILPIVASFIDLKLNTVFVQQNGSVAILGAQLKNNGNLPITHADLTVYSEDGLIFSEPWNGLLVAGDDIIYVLSGQPSYPLLAYDDLNSYYCIQSVGYSGLNVESDLTNNEACKNIESNEVILKPVYPNPTGSTITLGLIVPKSTDLSADLVDAQGRVVKQLIYPFTLASGEYTYVFDLTSIANGTYSMRFTADGKTALHRIVVLK